jgi:hypothetical protein
MRDCVEASDASSAPRRYAPDRKKGKNAGIVCLCSARNIETIVAVAGEFNCVAGGNPKRGILIIVIGFSIDAGQGSGCCATASGRQAELASQFPKFAALPFVAIDDDVVVGAPVRCINERAAIICAERLLTVFGNVGSVVLRRSAASSDKLDVIQIFGEVPSEGEFPGTLFEIAETARQANH